MESYDAIIIGARCAGASLSMLLARKGHRVLLVDKAALPSDMPLSTHFVQQPAIERLRQWGVLPTLQASGCPAIPGFRWDLGPFALEGTPPPAGESRLAYGPRRFVLDRILMEAAVDAGVELRDGAELNSVEWTDGAVSGVRIASRSGAVADLKARIVIGADGMKSKVAELARAPKYNEEPAHNGQIFAYWSGVPFERMELWLRPGRAVFGLPTNDGLSLVASAWSIGDFKAGHASAERDFVASVAESAPELADRLSAGHRETGFIRATVDGFYRKPSGKGWALVGDAGYTKDPCTASGITDAFRDAEALAEAVTLGLRDGDRMDDALAAYGKHRDEDTLAHYQFTSQMASLATPPPEMQQVFLACSQSPQAASQLFGVIAQTVREQDFFSPENLASLVGNIA